MAGPIGQVIIIDRDAATTSGVATFLTRQNYVVESFGRAKEGLSAVGKKTPDVVIVDEEFAVSKTKTLLESIRKLKSGELLPIIAITPQPIDPKHPTLADFRLRRPFQMPQLLKVLQAFRREGEYQRQKVNENILRSTARVPTNGSLNRTPFWDLFSRIWRSVASGSIALKGGSTWRRIDFVNGFPIGVRSNLVTEHLLRYLLRLGSITPDVYRQSLRRSQKTDWDPSKSLVTPGVVTTEELSAARVNLAKEITLQCFKWPDAVFRFKEGSPKASVPPIVLNPFELYCDWLADPTTSRRFEAKMATLNRGALAPTPALVSHRHLLESYGTFLPDVEAQEGRIDPKPFLEKHVNRGDAKRFLISLTDLGVFIRIGHETATQKSKGKESAGKSPRKFERIRQMVEDDISRVEGASSPYIVLGLSEGASKVEIDAQYERFCRFYRPQTFDRLGDPELSSRVTDLQAAFSTAMTEISGSAPDESFFTTVPPDVAPKKQDIDGPILAEVFFDDGCTYLWIEDLAEAHVHFSRSNELEPHNAKYLTYKGWTIFRLAEDDEQRFNEAKLMLKSALQIEKRNDQAFYFLGCMYEKEGRKDHAMECWKRAIRLNPSNFDAQSALRKATVRTL